MLASLSERGGLEVVLVLSEGLHQTPEGLGQGKSKASYEGRTPKG